MAWAWDPVKAAANLAKHKVPFELAVYVFSDPLAASRPDPGDNGGEERWQTVGRPRPGELVLFVIHTEEGETDGDPPGRIISARQVTASERRQYDEGKWEEG